MKTLIAYGTKYGCTEKCAKALKEKLEGEVDLLNLKNTKDIDLSQYDKVIVGGSIYMGKIRKEVNEFCVEKLNILKNKKLGIFICCMREGEVAETEIRDAFPQELVDKAITQEYFGGEFTFKKMNFMERFIVKKVSNIEKDSSNIFEKNINRCAQIMNNA